MKKITLLLGGVLISSLTFAGTRDEIPAVATGMAVVKTNATSYRLIYKSEQVSDVKIKILDSKNELVFSETIKKSNGFSRPYSFETLPEGEYTIKIDNGSNWLTETIEYRYGKVEKLAHVTRISEGKYLLTVAGQGKDQIMVRIFDDQGNSVYSYLVPVEGNFAQLYNLSELTGPFTFEVTDKNGVSKMLNK